MKRYLSKLKKCSLRLLNFSVALTILIPLFSFLIVPAQAASIQPAMKVTNLLDGAYFDFYVGDEFDGRYSGTTSEFVGRSASWVWTTNPNVYYDVISIVISGDKPDTLSFTQNGRTSACEYEGSVGDQHMYSFHNHGIGDVIKLTASYSLSRKRVFNLVSVLGYYDVSENVTTMLGRSRYYNTIDEGWSDFTQKSTTSLPLYLGNEGIPMNSRFESVFEVRPSDRQTEYPESISFLVRVTGQNTIFGASLVESASGNPVTVLTSSDVTTIGYGAYDTEFETDDSNVRYNWYLVTYDLTGYDIVGKTIRFTCSSDIEQGYVNVAMFACSISALVKDNPNFWGRLYDKLQYLWEAIVYGDGEIVDTLKEGLGVDADQSTIDDVNEGNAAISGAEGQYIEGIEQNTNVLLDTFDFQFVSVSLAFVATYFNKAFLGLGSYSIVLLLPLAIAWILFLLNRVTPSMAPRIRHLDRARDPSDINKG